MANPVTFTPMAGEHAARPAALPELPWPANARPQPGPVQVAGRRLTGWQQFRLDPDIALALEDQQRTSGLPWEQWLEQAANEALRTWIGRG